MATVAVSGSSNCNRDSKIDTVSGVCAANLESLPSTLDQDGALDIDTLKQFTIPKKSKSKKELFEPVSVDSHQYQNDILHVLQHSYRDRDSVQHYLYSNPRLVHNSNLLQTFLQKKKCMKQDGYVEKELQEVYGFVCYHSPFEARRACEPGITVGNKLCVNCLGNPKMGVYLSKNADVIFSDPPKSRQHGTLVIFKVIKGRVKLFRDGSSGESLEPTPNFDCHQMKVSTTVDITSVQQPSSFQNSQIYIYEYTEDSDLADRPRQIYPFAIVDFIYTGAGKDDVRSRLAPKPPISLSNKKTENSDPVINTGHVRVPVTPTLPLAKVPRLLHSTDVSTNRGNMLFGATGYFPPPRRNGVIDKSTSKAVLDDTDLRAKMDNSLNCKKSDSPVKSKRAADNLSVIAVSSGRNVDDLSTGNVKSDISADKLSVGSSFESNGFKQDQSVLSATGSAEDLSVLATNAGSSGYVDASCKSSPVLCENTELNQQYTVWCGKIAVNGTDICDAEIKSCNPLNVLPWTIGSSLNLSNKLLTSSARTRYLQHLSSVIKTKEQCSGDYRLSYARLQPTSTNCIQLARFILYLVKSQCAAFVEYPDQRAILLLTDFCDISKEFGLSDQSETDKVFLHVFFVSPNSLSAVADKDLRTASPPEAPVGVVPMSSSAPSDTPVMPLTEPLNTSNVVSTRDPRVQN